MKFWDFGRQDLASLYVPVRRGLVLCFGWRPRVW